MPDEEFWRRMHENVMDRIDTELEIIERTEEADVDELIDGECARCGRRYYSDYLMHNMDNCDKFGEPIDELCIECYLKQKN